MGGNIYLAVVTNRNDNSFLLNSSICKFNLATLVFDLFQANSTKHAISLSTSRLEWSPTWLFNARGESSKTNSEVFKWNGTAFASTQLIPTKGAWARCLCHQLRDLLDGW